MASIPSDPLFSAQWHLQNTEPGFLDLNIVDLWADYTGENIDIAIVDDGVQLNHPDLDGNYSVFKDWDFRTNDTDANSVNFDDNHGTAVAGIIGANVDNTIGGVGVAHGATIFGFRVGILPAIANAIDHASGLTSIDGLDHTADVVNMSLGTSPQAFFDIHPNGPLFLGNLNQAIEDAVLFGRDGLGTILVKSAGNSRQENQDTNASSWNATPQTISVASVEQDGFVSFFSTHGASLLVSAFGTAGEVVTTDRTGRSGYSPGDYTATFSGTSAAAPMVSGVVALMLEANPFLGWRDVQEILAYSARHVGSEVGTGPRDQEEYAWTFNGATNWNGGGLHFSNDYGFGLVDAKAAVRLAETWGDQPQTSTNIVAVSQDFLDTTTTLDTNKTSFSQAVAGDIDIDYVEVDVRFLEWYDLGDLTIRLVSPSGTASTLINNSGEDDGNASTGFGFGRWQFYSNAFRGERPEGTWTLELVDQDSPEISPITIDDIQVRFYGEDSGLNETFIFTEAYSEYANGEFGHRVVFDGGLGLDTLNAAAVDSDSYLDLTLGEGLIDGIRVQVSGIENGFTGDGNDILIGDGANNQLVGMRGDDNLVGNGGDDVLMGGAGNDIIYGGVDNDYINGTSYFAQGAGERDSLTSGNQGDRDVFVLGERENGDGRVFYDDAGNRDYAVIQDFDGYNHESDIADTIQLVGSADSYSISDVSIDGIIGAGIRFSNDVIGIVAGISAASLDLTDSNQFTYV